jgi:hypothetical protein
MLPLFHFQSSVCLAQCNRSKKYKCSATLLISTLTKLLGMPTEVGELALGSLQAELRQFEWA